MALSAIELRILGSLLEKERTTPELYPLTTNSLANACNQKTNREPVSNYKHQEIEDTLRFLSDKGLTQTSRADNERVFKHKHKLSQAMDLNGKGFAVLAVLILRGKQTPGELRNRTERYVHFTDLNDVEHTLEQLRDHQPSLVKNYGRGPGQSQDRWGQTLGKDEEDQLPRVRASSVTTVASVRADSIEDLRAEIDTLKDKMQRLYEHLGLEANEDTM